MARNMSARTDSPQKQDWEMLLGDILELRDIFFTCLEETLCYEIYASALMTSGKIPTIKLASGVIACEATVLQSDEMKLVPYKRSVELVLTAAEEYFNSASSLDDPSLQIARACLNLIKDGNEKIKAELDLIESLQVLQSFGISILPIQARLCEDKMSLIEECLHSDPNAYQKSQKLINLARLLRVAGNESELREGLVLQRIAECGLKSGPAGWDAVLTSARRLAELRHAPAAALLSRVALSPVEPQLRRSLLDAALTYMDASMLERTLKASLIFELEDLEKQVLEKTTTADLVQVPQQHTSTDSADEEFVDAVQTPNIEDKEFIPSNEETKREKENLLKQKIWNKNAPYSVLKKSSPTEDEKKDREEKIRVPEFYASVYPNYAVTDFYYRYDRFSPQPTLTDDSVNLALSFLRLFYLSYYLDRKDVLNFESLMMQRCGLEMMWVDTPLSTACTLRSLRGHLDVELFAACSSTTAVCVLLYPLLLAHNLHALDEKTFLQTPKQLASLTFGATDPPHPRHEASDGEKTLMTMCVKRLDALVECEKLKEFGLSASHHLFHDDEDYRTQMIYRVASSSDIEQVKCALELGGKYELERERLWSRHAAALVTQPSPGVLSQLANQDMLDALRCHTQLIEEEIWDEISGSDHTALISYFTLMKNLDEKWSYAGLPATEHIKLLKKVKAASPDLDYKLLLSNPSEDQYKRHLLRILKAENVGLVTKLLKSLPASIKLPLSINHVYTLWLTDLFFSVDNSANSKKWMQRYRQCLSYFNKLNQQDLRTFILKTCFSDLAVKRVPANTRNLMIMQAVDYCQQEQENDFKTSTRMEPNWSELGLELMLWAQYLENFHSSTVQDIINKDCVDDKNVWMRLEICCGEISKAMECLSELALCDHVTPSSLTALIRCLNLGVSIDQLLMHILDKDIDEKQIQDLVRFMTLCKSSSIVLSESVVERATRRAKQLRLHSHTHISLLSLTQTKKILEDGDLSNITHFSLQLLQSEWSNIDFIKQLSENDLVSDEGRKKTFLICMKESNNWQKKKVLVDILCCWPIFQPSDSSSVYYEFAEWLLADVDNQAENGILLKLLFTKPLLARDEVIRIAENVNLETIENVLWIIILSKIQDSSKIIQNLFQKFEPGSISLGDDTAKELLTIGLFTKLVNTPAYMPLLDYIINKQTQSQLPHEDSYTLEWAINELRNNGFIAEAGQLALLHQGVPISLKTFTESIKCFKKKFYK